MLLILRSWPEIDGYAAEIERTVGIGQRRLVQINGLQAIGRPDDFAFRNQIQHTRIGGTVKIVRLFDGSMAAAASFFVSDNIHFRSIA